MPYQPVTKVSGITIVVTTVSLHLQAVVLQRLKTRGEPAQQARERAEPRAVRGDHEAGVVLGKFRSKVGHALVERVEPKHAARVRHHLASVGSLAALEDLLLHQLEVLAHAREARRVVAQQLAEKRTERPGRPLDASPVLHGTAERGGADVPVVNEHQLIRGENETKATAPARRDYEARRPGGRALQKGHRGVLQLVEDLELRVREGARLCLLQAQEGDDVPAVLLARREVTVCDVPSPRHAAPPPADANASSLEVLPVVV